MMQEQKQTNKWLTMGVTPPHLIPKVIVSENKQPLYGIAAKGRQLDFVLFCTWLADTFPNGFTYTDIKNKKGRTSVYWSQLLWRILAIQPGIIALQGYKPSGSKKGRLAIYTVDTSKIPGLRIALQYIDAAKGEIS